MKRKAILKLFVSLTILLFSQFSYGKELIIGTTFSYDSLQHLISEWEKQPNTVPVRLLNRTSQSLSQTMQTEKANDIDLIISSSPMLFYNLQQYQKLSKIPTALSTDQSFVPPMLKETTMAFSLSGYGILVNTEQLHLKNLPLPKDWQDLANPELQGLLVMSSPTRSETNHIMIEAMLQKIGWQQGWQLIHQIMANVGTISSRSFGVAEKIQIGLGGVGITIDNYANILTHYAQSPKLAFSYFPNFPISPTFIAITATSNNKQQAQQFIQFLLSQKGQMVLSNEEIGKYPILPLPKNHHHYLQQQYLFNQTQIDYPLMIKRQSLVKLIFEHQILYRLNQIQENWKILYQKEKEKGKTLEKLRNILTALPISEQQANDENYLNNINLHKELLMWQQFFLKQQENFNHALMELE